MVVAVDLDEGRLEKARVRDCRPFNPGKEDLSEVAKSLTDGRGADCAIEAVGKPATVRAALESVRSGGKVSVIGVVVGGKQISIDFLPCVMDREDMRSSITMKRTCLKS